MTRQEKSNAYAANFQNTQKSVASVIPGASVFSPLGGTIKEWVGEGSDTAAIIGGMVDPSSSLSRVWGDVRSGNISGDTLWDLALPFVGNMINARKNRGKNNDLAMAQKQGFMQSNPGGSINNYSNAWSAARGGVVPFGARVSLEKNEVSLGPDGTMKKWNLPPHPNSSAIPFQPGTFIFSDDRKYKMPDGRLPAEAAARLEKVVNDKSATPLARKSASRQLQNIAAFQQKKSAELEAQGKISPTDSNIPEAKDGGWINTLTQLAPVILNALQSTKPAEKLDPTAFQNPLAYSALESLRNRRPDLAPALQATDSMTAAADQNLRGTATGRGQYMSGRIGLANAGMAAKAGIYAQGQQQRNQYLGEYGNAQGVYGQKIADTNLMISDLNARNAAAQRQFGSAAASQLSQWSQVQQQMANQKLRDEQFMKSYQMIMDLWNKTGLGKPAQTLPTYTPPAGGYYDTIPNDEQKNYA